MRLPARFIAGNLVWAPDGSVWAVFRVEPFSYPWLPHHEKLRLHRQTRAALRVLPSEALVLSLCAALSSRELSRRVAPREGDPTRWAEVAGPAERMASELRPTERLSFLAAKLDALGPRAGTPLLGSAAAAVGESFGLPRRPVGSAEVARKAEQAGHLLSLLQGLLPIRPATAAEVCWIYAGAVRRGLADPALDLPGSCPGTLPGGRANGAVARPSLVALADAVFKEGGLAGDPDRPGHRRYLRVETEAGVAYQALLALSDMPHRYHFPGGGGEWLPTADTAGFPVDWCVRMRPIANRVAQASARRQARQLQSQVGEYDGDPAGTPPGLTEAMEAIHDLRAQLSANPTDAELQATTILAVGSEALGDLEEKVAALRALYATGEYGLHRPIGGQLGLFAAMLPGSPSRPPVRDYVHHLLCRDLAAGMPFGAAGVGDPQGMLLGYCVDAGTFRPVLFDPAYGPSVNRSGSLGAFGALGSGKSYFVKNVVHAALARGGRVAALDRSATGEYVRLAPVAPGRSQVVAVGGDSSVCLDPLRVFSGEARVGISVGFLTLATGTSLGEPQGLALSEAVRTVASRRAGRLADVVDVLEEMAVTDPGAEAARRTLRETCRSPLARFAFGSGEVAALDADYLVFHAPGLSLPDRETALREHLARRLLPEQVLSQAVLYLVAAVARQVTFSDPDRFAAALFDEAWYLTASLQGRSLLLDGIRDGRKHNAAVWIVSQHPNDLGDDELAHLLGPRFVFRQARAAAPAALHFVGVEPTERAVDLLAGATEGSCLFRDVQDRVGRIQVLPAMTEELHTAFETNPAAGRRPA